MTIAKKLKLPLLVWFINAEVAAATPRTIAIACLRAGLKLPLYLTCK